MLKNRKLSHAIHQINWASFIMKLEQKAVEYDTFIYKIDRWFPSTKMCSVCGAIQNMPLSERIYKCACGNMMNRDLNAAINIRNVMLNDNKSLEYSDNKHGEILRPLRLNYVYSGNFNEVFTKTA